MGSGTAHDFDEMPVFLRGIRVSFDVADDFAVSLGRRVKSERAFNIFVLQVAVDRLRAADNLNTGVMRRKVFSQNRRIGIGIVAADDDDRRNSMLLADIRNDRELFVRFQLRSAGTDDIESACVAVLVDVGIIKNQIIIFNQTDRTVFKAIENVFFIRGF